MWFLLKSVTFITRHLTGFGQKPLAQWNSRWKTVSIPPVKPRKWFFSTHFVNIFISDRRFIEFRGFSEPKNRFFSTIWLKNSTSSTSRRQKHAYFITQTCKTSFLEPFLHDPHPSSCSSFLILLTAIKHYQFEKTRWHYLGQPRNQLTVIFSVLCC